MNNEHMVCFCHDLDHHQANKKKRKLELPYRSSYEGHISIRYGRGKECEVCFYLISIYTYILLRQGDNRYFTCRLLGTGERLCLNKSRLLNKGGKEKK